MKTKMTLLKEVLFLFLLMTGAIALFSFAIPAASAAMLQPSDLPGEVGAATGGETSLRGLILKMVNYALTFLGLLAVIMVIYGGFTYVSSAGSEEATGNAKKIIMYALIGIVIILLSFVIVNAILGAGTGTA